MVVLAASGVCKIFSDSIFGWIIADQKIIDGAAGIFWMPAVILMIKVFYRFEMLYLQGIGKERFAFWNTVAASILAGVGAVSYTHLVETGDVVVLTAGIPALDVNAAREGISNMMRIATIE